MSERISGLILVGMGLTAIGYGASLWLMIAASLVLALGLLIVLVRS